MLLLLVALAWRGHAVRVRVARPCPYIESQTIAQASANALLVVDGLDARPLTHMELYATARALAPNAPESAVVVTDCTSGRVGLAFSDFLVGMDCSRTRVDDLMSEIDTLDPADSQTTKLAYLLTGLSRWNEEQACRPITDRWQVFGAALFWAPLIALVLWFRHVY